MRDEDVKRLIEQAVKGRAMDGSPPNKEWIGLTDEERKQIVSYINNPFEWSHAVEAKLKEKNT